jgi:superfamily II DNA or RNA helicase
MKLTVIVGPIRLKITPTLPKEDFIYLRKKLTYRMKGYEYTRQHKEFGWDGKKRLLYRGQSAPSGCIYRIQQVLEKLGHQVNIIHENDYEPTGTADIFGAGLLKHEKLVLEKFQKTAIKRALQCRRGVISAPVRAGKTAIAGALIKNVNHYPACLVTEGKDLVKQTRNDLADHLRVPIGYFSEGKYEPADILVTSYQAIRRVVPKVGVRLSEKIANRNAEILKYLRATKVIIFDECHHALSPKNRKIFGELVNAGYIIGLSGTPKSDNVHILELEAAIGSIILKVKYETLIKHKRLARPMITMYQLPYRWFASGLREYEDIYESNIVENIHRNMFIADIVKNLNKVNKTSFVMIRRRAHGPILRALIPGSVYVHGNVESDLRAELYKSLQNKDIHCIIATVGKEGLNLPALDAVINAEGYKSSVTTKQKMRSLTAAPGKEYGIVVDFMDKGKFLGKHSQRRLAIYKTLGDIKLRIKKVPKDIYPMEDSRWRPSNMTN